jgi:hypothetical protein
MKVFISVLMLLFSVSSFSQEKIVFKSRKIPVQSGFKMDDYWVWGGSAIKVGSTYHLFASRWKRTGPFPEGYRQGSEIVRATSNSPLGPFTFKEVVIGERDSSFWDSNMAHNPTIHKIGSEYVLFYIGSDFTTMNKNSNNLLRRIGYATATSIEGPWKRCDTPVIDSESNNPAILQDGNSVKLLFRDNELKVIMAEADSYKGPFRIMYDNVWPDCKLEDFYLFKNSEGYHIICEDNVGGVSGHVRWGVHLVSRNGIDGWKKYDPVIAYDHDIRFKKDSVLHCVRCERPQLLIVNNKITCLYNGVYDGKDSWCQPVKLRPVRLR